MSPRRGPRTDPARDPSGPVRRRAGRSRAPLETAPSREAIAALGPYARARLTVRTRGLALPLDVPFDVFAAHAVDDGTLLLLRNLPAAPPSSFLDLGCGYGALGLPVASLFPNARAVLVDRDLLAVRTSAHNARMLRLDNVEAAPGLGYRDLAASDRFDWILCNVPARIGRRAIGYFLEAGRARLTATGELRVVVIRDLCEMVEEQAARRGLHGLRRVADGRRHVVYGLARGAAADARTPDAAGSSAQCEEREEVYARDQMAIEVLPGTTLALARPQDASEDPGRPGRLALLFDALPRSPRRHALSYRCGYGAVPLCLRARYPRARVVAQDRDLLALAFARKNALALGLAGGELRFAQCLFPEEAMGEDEADLVIGESSAPAGPLVFARELREARDLLAPDGEALVLVTDKQVREWLAGAAGGIETAVLARRAGGSVVRISRQRAARPSSSS